jgi:hypothetical protein
MSMNRRTLLAGVSAATFAASAPTFTFAAAATSPDRDAPDAPAVRISNGIVTAVLYMPDNQKGYYRATRFDWSGQIADLRAGGHSYFGRWFADYDPKKHDAIMGPVEDYVTGQGFDAAPIGGTFVKLGVGVLRKPAEPIRGFPTLEVVDYGKWTTRVRDDGVEFIHEVNDPVSGYGYRYSKTISLPAGQSRMVMSHRLESTGINPIDTEMYNHNFFILDGEKSGPNVEVRFPFQLTAFNKRGDRVELQGERLTYVKPLVDGADRMQLKGFGLTSADYDIQVRNRKTGAGVRVRGDRPLSDLVFWTSPAVYAPEPYIRIQAERGKPASWTFSYDFYSEAGANA